MGVYDDVCTFDFSPTSTVSTSSSSSSSSSSELASPVSFYLYFLKISFYFDTQKWKLL